MIDTLKNLRTSQLFSLLFIPFLFSALLNHGFLASDEYWTGITRYIPAQTAEIHHLVTDDDVKSPMQIIPMHAVAQTALALGATHPYAQYVVVVFVLGILNSLLILLGALRFGGRLGLVAVAFYFASPSVFTRPMFEVMSTGWLTLAAAEALMYDQKPQLRRLLYGALFGAIAFCMRPQTGIVCLVFPLLSILHRRSRDFIGVAALGVILVLLSGLPDYWLRGQWHFSLRYLISYNFEHGADYGRQVWYFYFPLLFALALGPWWIHRAKPGFWLSYLKKYRSSWIMIALFILEHMLFAQKFERFLIPILPLVVLLFTPLLSEFLKEFSHRRWRVVSLFAVNAVIYLAATFSAPQGNMIAMEQYIEKHPEIQSIWSFDESLTWLPEVFADRGRVDIQEVKSVEEFSALPCPKWLMVRSSQLSVTTELTKDLERKAEFSSGIIDTLAYNLNRSHNIRRAPSVLFGCH